MGEPAHLGREASDGTTHLAQHARLHPHPLVRRLPIHPPDLDARIVVEAGGEIGFGEIVRAERPLDLGRCRRRVRASPSFARREAGGGFEHRTVEGEVAVVVREAALRAVAANEAPAPAERGRALARCSASAGGSCLMVGSRRSGCAEWRRASGLEVDLERVRIEPDGYVVMKPGRHDGPVCRDVARTKSDPAGRRVDVEGAHRLLDSGDRDAHRSRDRLDDAPRPRRMSSAVGLGERERRGSFRFPCR